MKVSLKLIFIFFFHTRSVAALEQKSGALPLPDRQHPRIWLHPCSHGGQCPYRISYQHHLQTRQSCPPDWRAGYRQDGDDQRLHGQIQPGVPSGSVTQLLFCHHSSHVPGRCPVPDEVVQFFCRVHCIMHYY